MVQRSSYLGLVIAAVSPMFDRYVSFVIMMDDMTMQAIASQRSMI